MSDVADELLDYKIASFDIETHVIHDKPSIEDLPKFIGFRAPNGRKVRYHISEREAIQKTFDYFKILTGHNIIDYDIPIMEAAGYVLTNKRGFHKHIILDTMTITQKRCKVMMYLDLTMAEMALGSLAKRFDLPIKKGDIDYKLFKQSTWTVEELALIDEYLFGDLDTQWELLKYYYRFFYGFKAMMNEKDQRYFQWIRSASGSNAYKIICHQAGLPEEYDGGFDTTEERMKYPGAYVALPEQDFVDDEEADMYCVDFSSLYPHMNMGGNLFSVVDPRDPHAWHGGKIFVPIEDAQDEDGKDGVTGYYSRTPGKIENTLADLYNGRQAIKKEQRQRESEIAICVMLGRKEIAYKIVLNTAYGIVGSPIFKSVYNRTTAADCTAMGRLATKHARSYLTDNGYLCLYTDSVTGDNSFTFRHNGERKVMSFTDFHRYVMTNIKHQYDGDEKRGRFIFLDSIETPSMDNNLIVEWKRVEYLYAHKTDKRIWKLKTQYGEVSVTEDHSLMDVKSQKGLHQVKPLDAKRCIYYNGINNPDMISHWDIKVVLLGYFNAIGKINKKGWFVLPNLASTKDTNVMFMHTVARYLRKEGFRFVMMEDGIYIRGEVARQFLLIKNEMYITADMPDHIKKNNDPVFIASYLRGVFSATYSLYWGNKITMVHTNKQFMDDVRELIHKLGVFTTKGMINPWLKLQYRISITGRCREWWMRNIGTFNVDHHMRILRAKAPKTLLKYGRITQKRNLPKKERIVYDIEVADNHNFFANDVLVHNTDSVYFMDRARDPERVKRICGEISELQRKDMNIYVPTHNLEIECKIAAMWFYRDKKGKFNKKFYSYLKIDKKSILGVKIVNKGIKIVKGDCKPISVVIYKKYIRPRMLRKMSVLIDLIDLYTWSIKEIMDDPDSMSKRYRIQSASYYEKRNDYEKKPNGPTSIQFNIASQYGSGEHYLYDNDTIGIGKTKKYATKEELVKEYGDDWVKHLNVRSVIEDLANFIPSTNRTRRINKMYKDYTKTGYFVDTKRLIEPLIDEGFNFNMEKMI